MLYLIQSARKGARVPSTGMPWEGMKKHECLRCSLTAAVSSLPLQHFDGIPFLVRIRECLAEHPGKHLVMGYVVELLAVLALGCIGVVEEQEPHLAVLALLPPVVGGGVSD